jgi:hypothetical protein
MSPTALGEYKKRVGEVIGESQVDRPACGEQAVPQCAEEHLSEDIDVESRRSCPRERARSNNSCITARRWARKPSRKHSANDSLRWASAISAVSKRATLPRAPSTLRRTNTRKSWSRCRHTSSTNLPGQYT